MDDITKKPYTAWLEEALKTIVETGTKKLGMESVPCVCVDDLTPEQVNAMRLVDNKSNESDWDVADKAGISSGLICEYLHKNREPQAKTIIKLAKTLGVSSDYLLGLTNRPTQRI